MGHKRRSGRSSNQVRFSSESGRCGPLKGSSAEGQQATLCVQFATKPRRPEGSNATARTTMNKILLYNAAGFIIGAVVFANVFSHPP
jgi:hypothetical protein